MFAFLLLLTLPPPLLPLLLILPLPPLLFVSGKFDLKCNFETVQWSVGTS